MNYFHSTRAISRSRMGRDVIVGWLVRDGLRIQGLSDHEGEKIGG